MFSRLPFWAGCLVTREIGEPARHRKCSAHKRNHLGSPRSKTVELKSHVVQTAADSNVRFRGLTLVKPHKPVLSLRRKRSGIPIFSSAEMRHNFAIWALEPDAASGRRLHVYYCLSCKWVFSVEDRRYSVTPLDLNGNPIQGAEAAEKLTTFALGPCPVFSRLTEDRRVTQEVTPLETFRGRLAALILAGCRAWKVKVWRCVNRGSSAVLGTNGARATEVPRPSTATRCGRTV
jgi:hypothetical protein